MKFNLLESDRFQIQQYGRDMVRLRSHAQWLRKHEVDLQSQLDRSKTELQLVDNQLLNALEAIKSGDDESVTKVAIESLYRLQKDRYVASEAIKIIQLNLSGLRAEMKRNDEEIDKVAEEIDQLVQGD